jgi:hypothetical protein
MWCPEVYLYSRCEYLKDRHRLPKIHQAAIRVLFLFASLGHI